MLLNFELGVVPAAENYFELFKNSYFTDVPTLIGDLKTFFSFQIEHLTLKFACTLTKIKMLQCCGNIAATRFCCRKDPQEKCNLLPVTAIVLATFAAISLEAILLPEMLPELGQAQWSFLFNFLFLNLEGNGANNENNFH